MSGSIDGCDYEKELKETIQQLVDNGALQYFYKKHGTEDRITIINNEINTLKLRFESVRFTAIEENRVPVVAQWLMVVMEPIIVAHAVLYRREHFNTIGFSTKKDKSYSKKPLMDIKMQVYSTLYEMQYDPDGEHEDHHYDYFGFLEDFIFAYMDLSVEARLCDEKTGAISIKDKPFLALDKFLKVLKKENKNARKI